MLYERRKSYYIWKKQYSYWLIFVILVFAFLVFCLPSSLFSSSSLFQFSPYFSLNMSQNFKELIIVPGHTIYNLRCPLTSNNIHSEECYYMEPYQKGQLKAILKHIETGIELTKTNKSSLLLFSGGQTKLRAGPISEGQSYSFIGEVLASMSKQEELVGRISTEEFATDSYENLLFSIARFKEMTGIFPLHITVIGFTFKEKRFTELHRKAIGYPKANFSYIGLDNITDIGSVIDSAYTDFVHDLYGCSKTLSQKRIQRNPFLRYSSYRVTVPELLQLFDLCKLWPQIPSTIKVPWNSG